VAGIRLAQLENRRREDPRVSGASRRTRRLSGVADRGAMAS
jgi:hypothetical protein